MKYSPEVYAKSFDAALADAQNDRERDTMVKRFVSMLAKYGDLGRSDRILDSVARASVRRRGGRWVRIEVARIISGDLLKKLKGQYGEEDHVEVIVNPAIVAGVRVTIDEERELDFSFATRIKKLLNV